MKQPTPEEIKQARTSAGLSQARAGQLIGVTWRAWAHWEKGTRKMSAANFELFKMKTEAQ